MHRADVAHPAIPYAGGYHRVPRTILRLVQRIAGDDAQVLDTGMENDILWFLDPEYLGSAMMPADGIHQGYVQRKAIALDSRGRT